MNKRDFNPISAVETMQLGLILPFIALCFVALKLNGNIDWSWWWVLSPLVLHAVIFVILILAVCLACFAAVMYFVSVALKWFSDYLKEKSNV